MHTLDDLYCNECGAANPRQATTCCACQRPLDLSPVQDTPAVPTPAGPVQIQFNLSSGSMTMIQLQQPQATQNLLHERYQVLAKVGTGGFGAVYKARDTGNRNRLVAIKAIELDTLSASQSIEATDTFNRELGLLSTLEHPNLPHIYEHFIDATHWYLVMDFIDGAPLDEHLQQVAEDRLPLKEVIEIALQLCDVLHYLHQCKPPVIFRDVKPANIMLTPGGKLYLIDFGIARRFKPGQVKDTTPLGSPGFAAPEQYGKSQTTTRSDIYGLGATLYFLLTGYDPANSPFHLPPILSLCP
ncbi:MAG: serine/threonine-protein kinase, partial [Ktedonobacteraceae bacterium]